MTSNKIQSVRSGVFIDGSNLFWAVNILEDVGKEKWAIDFSKLKRYLKDNYSPIFFKFYNCVDEHPTNELFRSRALGTEKFHNKLKGLGYDFVPKPLKYLHDKKTGEISTKGDMDVSISIDIKNSLNDMDNIILFSGDSDFLPVVEDAHTRGKHIRIFSFEHTLAWELKEFSIKNTRCNYKLLDELRDKIEYLDKKWVRNGAIDKKM